MAVLVRWSVIALVAVSLTHGALGQDKPPELTSAGAAILAGKLAIDGRPLYDRPGPEKPITFPLAMCTFPGGLCGAVRRDGTVAVPPRYDWVGKFSGGRAAIRSSGLYGFVDEDGREIVRPQYRLVDDYSFGFAQVDIDGKSALIDRDGRIVMEPKYGFIRAIAPDRFAVSQERNLGGQAGGEDFSGTRVASTTEGGISVTISGMFQGYGDGLFGLATDIIDASGQRIRRIGTLEEPPFDKNDPSIHRVKKDDAWGLAYTDGKWLVEPKFQELSSLSDGLARVKLNGKVGYIDRTGNFAIEPIFDKIGWFTQGFGQTWAEQGNAVGVIDKTGKWVVRTNDQQINPAIFYGKNSVPTKQRGWNFKKNGRWGFLDLDGRVVLDADFDQAVRLCADDRIEAYLNKEMFYFKADGTPLQPPDGRLYGAGCYGGFPPFTMKIGNKFQLVDINSIPLTPLQYDEIRWAGEGIKNVKINGKWGRIAHDGRTLLEPKYDYLSPGLDIFVASLDGKRGFMRPDGTWLIEPKFEAAARRHNDDAAFVTLAGATGVLRLSDQSWIVPPRSGVMCDIDHALMWGDDDKRVVLSKTGATWIDIGAERVGTNLEFGLLTFLKNGKWGLVDTAGRIMVEPQFEEPVYFSPGLRGVAWAKRDRDWCAIDRHGRSVPGIPCQNTNTSGWDIRFVCKVER